MIYVEINGRLGNNLFQLATAKKLGDEITLYCKSEREVKCIELYKDSFFAGYPVVCAVPESCVVYQETSGVYQPIPYDEQSDLLLKGYFQSHMYFDWQKTVDMYRCPEAVAKDIKDRYGQLLESEAVVSVNVRRGDYLQQAHRHPFVGKYFLHEAMNSFGSEVHFIVSSDDIAWCKKHLTGENVHYLENSYPMLDLFIQTVCHHNIISNSTFSWWGAYLNPHKGKRVIYPSRWYGMSADIPIRDLIPEEWEVVKSKYDVSVGLKAFTLHIKYLLSKFVHKYIWKDYQ